jgi:DNA-binding NarL/FixJ family response regulator
VSTSGRGSGNGAPLRLNVQMMESRSNSRPVEITKRLNIVVIDPLHVVRAALALLIDEQPDMAVVAQAGDAEEGLDAIAGYPRRRLIALVGLGLEGEHDAYWMIRTLRERFPTLSVLACGANSEPVSVSRALFVGADGFVDKNADPIAFLDALRDVMHGEVVLAGPPTSWIPSIADDIDRRRDLEPILTAREVQVLAVAAEGLTSRQIATRLGVQERTVTTHLGRIYGKLGVGSRVAAIRSAARSGLVSVGVAD